MVDINKYFEDGADYQSKCVLAYIKGRNVLDNELYSMVEELGKYGIRIEVSRYENCREQGYTLTCTLGTKQRHYAFYEHRNSDEICVLISNKYCLNAPSVDDMWADKGENCTKWDYDKSFDYMHIQECGDWIIDQMVAFFKNAYAERAGKKAQANK